MSETPLYPCPIAALVLATAGLAGHLHMVLHARRVHPIRGLSDRLMLTILFVPSAHGNTPLHVQIIELNHLAERSVYPLAGTVWVVQ